MVICWREDRVAVGARAVVAARVVRVAVGQLDPHKVGHHPESFTFDEPPVTQQAKRRRTETNRRGTKTEYGRSTTKRRWTETQHGSATTKHWCAKAEHRSTATERWRTETQYGSATTEHWCAKAEHRSTAARHGS